jgi:hypothetical protein
LDSIGRRCRRFEEALEPLEAAAEGDRRVNPDNAAISLGHIAHDFGDREGAFTVLKEAEQIHRTLNPVSPFLRGGNGYEYGELLPDLEQLDDVERRARVNLNRAMHDADRPPISCSPRGRS